MEEKIEQQSSWFTGKRGFPGQRGWNASGIRNLTQALSEGYNFKGVLVRLVFLLSSKKPVTGMFPRQDFYLRRGNADDGGGCCKRWQPEQREQEEKKG